MELQIKFVSVLFSIENMSKLNRMAKSGSFQWTPWDLILEKYEC